MSIELKIPEVGESIREVQIGRWLKKESDSVEQDEALVELETDKASMELSAPTAGMIGKILKLEGDIVAVGDEIGYLEEGSGGSPNEADLAPSEREGTLFQRESSQPQNHSEPPPKQESSAENTANKLTGDALHSATSQEEKSVKRREGLPVTPAARRELRAHGLTAADIETTGARIDHDEVLQHVKEHVKQPHTRSNVDFEKTPNEKEDDSDAIQTSGELEEIVPMSLIRRRIAESLVQAQQQAALLTTFNEIDMTAVKQLRKAYRDSFQKKYGVKLGFTSFFVKAVVDALKEQPGLNAEIRENQIVYRRYYHIGVAIGSGKGIVVPVLRFADRMSFAEIEQAVVDITHRASENKLEPQELQGGTFTVTNGGVYGSLLSTPIVNPPQSGILGMHMIQDRPVAHEGQVVIRPMMYVALTYDHCIVDGREAVSFLKRVKDTIEDPARMLIEV